MNSLSKFIKTPSLNVFLGASNVGKTHFMLHLIKSLKSNFDYCVVFSSTLFNNPTIEHLTEEKLTFASFSVSALEKLFTFQEKNKNKRCLLILDDIIGTANLYHPIFDRLASSGRHYNITTFITAQHFYKIPPILRQNCFYLHIFKCKNKRTIKGLFEEFGGEFSDIKPFIKFISENTENYNVITKICQSSTDKIYECYKRSKAPISSAVVSFKAIKAKKK
jgi:hypothetical protein